MAPHTAAAPEHTAIRGEHECTPIPKGRILEASNLAYTTDMRLATIGTAVFACIAGPASAAEEYCKEVEVPVTIMATVPALPEIFDLPSISNHIHLWLGFLFNLPAQGRYTIRATHCTSTVRDPENNGRLQVLVHGICGSRHFFSGLESPSLGIGAFGGKNYSYVDYALSKGYDTLAVDRLGNGRSDKPNPFLVVHLPAQIEAMNSLLEQIRAGALGKPPQEIIWYGHSWGSILGQGLTTKYPRAVERLVLNGWTAFIDKAGMTTALRLQFWPARLADARKRFTKLGWGYLQPSSEEGMTQMNFWGAGTDFDGAHYDTAIAKQMWTQVGTVAFGELLTSALLNGVPSASFTGKVLVVTGKHDDFFCATSYRAGHVDCGSGDKNGLGGSWSYVQDDHSILARTGKQAFPRATRFDYFVPPNTGHCLHQHYSQKLSADTTEAWLRETLPTSARVSRSGAEAVGKGADVLLQHDEL
ncbi:hypothetical protein AC579_2347 [Pseudocercospora musae]|uniref:AB hydrolase-1 domain-containing protein n=1 Tax=Pseudocercospora musae TaxID=113226 RepID=A0A139IGP6_9PEZI|nr:hypothetical protein AC579_2347 [Pseudocercospora musae]